MQKINLNLEEVEDAIAEYIEEVYGVDPKDKMNIEINVEKVYGYEATGATITIQRKKK